MGWAAEMEREFIRARTREALMRLRAQGKRLGRPRKVDEVIARRAIEYVARGYTLKDAAKVLGVSYSTLARHLTQSPVLRSFYYEAMAGARYVKSSAFT